MSNPMSAPVVVPSAYGFRVRRLRAGLAAAGLVATLGLPAPVALAVEPAPEVYARTAVRGAAREVLPSHMLNEAASIGVVSPMKQSRPGGLKLSAEGFRSPSMAAAAFTKRFAKSYSAPKAVPTSCYDYGPYGPLLDVAASGLAFPPAVIDGPVMKRKVKVSNPGPDTIRFDGMVTTIGDFSALSSCGSSLGAGDSCTIEVGFSPLGLGQREGSLTLPVAGPGEALTVPLMAKAVAGVYGYVYPTCVEFAPTVVGDTSSFATVNVYGDDYSGLQVGLNLRPTLPRVSDFAITGTFCESSDPYFSYYLFEYCEVDVVFRPTQVGPRSDYMRLLSNAQFGLPDVLLLGTGVAPDVGILESSTDLIDFGFQDVGTTSGSQSITLYNTSTATSPPSQPTAGPKAAAQSVVNISAITVTGDYAQQNNCFSLSPGQNCTIQVTFSPTTTGGRPGTVLIASDAADPLLAVSLTGTGTLPVPLIEFSALSASFGSGVMGRPVGEQTITVKSVGRADLVISSIFVTGDFLQKNNCPGLLPPGAECAVTMSFLATIPGERKGTLTVLSNAAPGFKDAQLLGNGCRPFGPSGSRLADPGCR